jgi:hypothetical protein
VKTAIPALFDLVRYAFANGFTVRTLEIDRIFFGFLKQSFRIETQKCPAFKCAHPDEMTFRAKISLQRGRIIRI